MIHIFIVNPRAGRKSFAQDLRIQLAQMDGLEYYVFYTRYAGYETELVREVQEIFQGEKLRFYCCGGSGTMRNMLNGFSNLEEAEVAFFPCGLTNDFLKVFGKEAERFSKMEELIDGDVISVDYIRTNHGVALNSFSVGIDANILRRMEKYRVLDAFGNMTPYNMAILVSAFRSKPLECVAYLDDRQVEGNFSELFWANGFCLGGSLYFDEGAKVDDGKGVYCLVPPARGIKLLSMMLKAKPENQDYVRKTAECGYCSSLRLRRKDNAPLIMDLDGELIYAEGEWTAQIVPKGLHLVVPKGVVA